ncbi:MAG: PDZ domain-containing protein [Bacteroidales bacterium]|nr:PDZ domain-containing protein [Bacteroidales bacterium]
MESEPKKRWVTYLPIVFSLVLVAGILLGYELTRVGNGGWYSGGRYDKLTDLISYITSEYVDRIDRDALTEGGIYGILSGLDPHSQYITAEEFDEVNAPLTGRFEGIGIEFRMVNDSITVMHTIPGGPSEKAGIMAGDRILTVNDTILTGPGITTQDVMKKLKGPRGTPVKVEVFRKGLTQLLAFSLVRDVIPTYSLDVAYMPEPSTGYIRLGRFSSTTHEELRDAAQKLLDQGMKRLILDLRGNSGGYLQAAIELADEFLADENLIVYTEGFNRPRKYYHATTEGLLEQIPLVVLIDEGSASSSEILAGAIQDNDRGVTIGRRSYGKGLVQEQLDLPDGSAIRLTVARYYTPTGRCIQKPYDRNEGFEDYYAEPYQRYQNGEMEYPDSIPMNDSLRYTTPGGKVVFGGGGIVPDIFVPMEQGEGMDYYYALTRKGLIFRFAFDYTDSHRQELSRFVSFESFDRDFEVDDDLLAKLDSFALRNGITRQGTASGTGDERIRNLLKAYIARDLFNDAGFYPIYNRTDNGFLSALESLGNPD